MTPRREETHALRMAVGWIAVAVATLGFAWLGIWHESYVAAVIEWSVAAMASWRAAVWLRYARDLSKRTHEGPCPSNGMGDVTAPHSRRTGKVL